jgi:predicted alpha/beta hydrolase family esterase
MTPVLVIPGLGGSGPDHWQTHLECVWPQARRVQQDDWDKPTLRDWLERLISAVEARPGAVLVAHSLGCPLVAHMAAWRRNLSVGAALLVAPADVDSAQHTPGHIRSFAPIPRQTLPFRSIVVASTNDPYMEYERARELALAWGAEFVGVGACGHINVASGFGRWHAGERLIKSIVEEIRVPQLALTNGLPAAAGA